MTSAVLVLIDGFEEIEALATVDILRRGGVDVTTASLTDSFTVTGGHQIPVQADALFSDVDAQSADIVIIPGGTTAFDEHTGLKQELVARVAANKWVAAICAAPMVLGGLGLLKGKQATCYPGFEDYCTGADIQAVPTVVDGTIITGRGPGWALEFGLTILEQLTDSTTAADVRAGLLLDK